jgi:hypothetical protein
MALEPQELSLRHLHGGHDHGADQGTHERPLLWPRARKRNRSLRPNPATGSSSREVRFGGELRCAVGRKRSRLRSQYSIHEMAAAERIDRGYLGRVLRLTLLAPDIAEAILDGRQPPELGLPALLKPFYLRGSASVRSSNYGRNAHSAG